ncbi:MAG: rhomboid family intramembrane serine protease [Thermoleophilia bacterium]|nr:rhomboid family intramembrane serine protease [Thermoleophilia bacterium]
MPTCYRHPQVETGVSCSSCGRPICPDCMTQTPVGFRCPECSREKTVVRSGPAAISGAGNYPATLVLIGANVIAFLLTVATGSGGLSAGGSIFNDYSVLGFGVADGEWYRLVTGGFLHAGLLHIAFNMFALYFLGKILEPSVGTVRFVMIYFACLLAGSFGAILLSGSNVPTVGASGAVFGIFGAVFIIARGRGLNDLAREVGIILLINLALTFTISGISIGGHLGGVVGGAICGALVIAGERGRLGASAKAIEYGGIVAVGVVSAVAAIMISEPPTTTRVFLGLVSLVGF